MFSTLILETPRGNDVAFANIVAAVGSAEIINASRPRAGKSPQANRTHLGMWNLAGDNLLGFAEGNSGMNSSPISSIWLRSKLLHRQ